MHAPPISFDFETSSSERLWAEPAREGYARLLAVAGDNEECSRVTADPAEMRAVIESAPWLVGHTIAYDASVAARCLGLDHERIIAKAVDVRVLARLVEPPVGGTNPRERTDYGLDALAERYLGIGKTESLVALANELQRARPRGEKLADKFDIPTDDERYRRYAQRDAVVTWRLLDELTERLPDATYAKRESRLARIAARMSYRGIGVDRTELGRRLALDHEEAEAVRWRLSGRWGIVTRAKIGKPGKERAAEILAGAGIRVVRGASGAPLLNQAVLNRHRSRADEIGELVRDLLALAGDRGIPAQVVRYLADDGRVHPSIDMSAQATGRWSITAPGMTVMGKRGEGLRDRDLFRAREGHVLHTQDLAQIDVRGMAALSQDKAMIERLQPGRDWHAEVADLFLGGHDKVRRDRAKVLAHAINYNAGAETIAQAAGIDVETAAELLDRMAEEFPELVEFKAWVVRRAEEGELLDNGWGRKLRASVGREVTQAPGLCGQSWARDALAECLLRLDDAGLGEFMVLTVHDEVVFELPIADAERQAAVIAECMTFERDGVPILSSAGERQAERWGDCYR
jgi:DNA polymerase I